VSFTMTELCQNWSFCYKAPATPFHPGRQVAELSQVRMQISFFVDKRIMSFQDAAIFPPLKPIETT
jgi:hypothetical protein